MRLENLSVVAAQGVENQPDTKLTDAEKAYQLGYERGYEQRCDDLFAALVLAQEELDDLLQRDELGRAILAASEAEGSREEWMARAYISERRLDKAKIDLAKVIKKLEAIKNPRLDRLEKQYLLDQISGLKADNTGLLEQFRRTREIMVGIQHEMASTTNEHG